MGIVIIELQGSFGTRRQERFSAMKGGHAKAIADAINYLATIEMPKAILNDHECHRDGIEPSEGFGETGKKLLTEPAP